MTLEERTNALFTTVLVSPGSQIGPADLLRLHAGVAEALRTVRNEALEEAAKTADARRNNVNVPVAMAADDTAKIIGEDIRSLKSEVSRERETG